MRRRNNRWSHTTFVQQMISASLLVAFDLREGCLICFRVVCDFRKVPFSQNENTSKHTKQRLQKRIYTLMLIVGQTPNVLILVTLYAPGSISPDLSRNGVIFGDSASSSSVSRTPFLGSLNLANPSRGVPVDNSFDTFSCFVECRTPCDLAVVVVVHYC